MASEEAKAKFDRWHARQRELGACRCSECRATYPEKPTQVPATLVGMEELSDDWANIKVGEPVQGDIPLEDLQAITRAVVEGTEEEKARFYDPPAPKLDLEHTGVPRPSVAKVYEATIKRAMGGGGYDRDPAKLAAYERSVAQRAAEVEIKASAVFFRAKEAEHAADRARLTYEEARARLEAEFGKAEVEKGIGALEKLLGLEGDIKQLSEWAEDAEGERLSIRRSVAELGDSIGAIHGKLKTVAEKLK